MELYGFVPRETFLDNEKERIEHSKTDTQRVNASCMTTMRCIWFLENHAQKARKGLETSTGLNIKPFKMSVKVSLMKSFMKN